MNCDSARVALLEADLPVPDDSSELARHLQECDACARIGAALTRDMSSLRSSVPRRRRRHRAAVVAGASTLAAAAVLIAFVRLNRHVADPLPAVNAAPAGIVSVQVEPGKRTTVMQTKDPKVTIVWVTDDDGGGS